MTAPPTKVENRHSDHLKTKSQVHYILSYFQDLFKSIFPKNRLHFENRITYTSEVLRRSSRKRKRLNADWCEYDGEYILEPKTKV